MTIKEATKGAANIAFVAPVKISKEIAIFMGGGSKKIILCMLFFIAVVIDQVWLGNVLFPKNELLKSNVFVGLAITVGVILTKDLQNLIQSYIEKKVIGKKED